MKMKIVALLLGFSVLLFMACKKDKFTTTPQLKYKSISPTTAIKSNIINYNVSFTDDEGDIQDSVILVYKRYNISGGILTLDSFRLKMDPNGIPVARDGDLNIKFGYGEFITGTFFLNLESVDRQVSFGLIIRDKAGHRSNYVESDKITLKKL
jgi:hypothetical protein